MQEREVDNKKGIFTVVRAKRGQSAIQFELNEQYTRREVSMSPLCTTMNHLKYHRNGLGAYK